jgi:hypothetical protein
MAYAPPTSANETTLAVYLSQWLNTASNGKVRLTQRGMIGLSSFLVFKCECGDNWHVGVGEFKETNLPQHLIDWVKKHRHVCTKFHNQTATNTGVCQYCGWPYPAHEESWINNQTSEGVPLHPKYETFWEGSIVPTTQPAPKGHVAYKEKPLPTFKGRKFRDSDEGV